MKQFLRTLPVKLTITEIAKKSADLARELQDLARAKEDADRAKRELADGLKSREATIARLAQHVHEKAEPREVDCHEELDLGSAIARVYRDDTGEFVDSRPMTEAEIRSERQAELPNISPGRRVDLRDPVESVAAAARAIHENYTVSFVPAATAAKPAKPRKRGKP